MRCPRCDVELRVGRRSGVVLDWCPSCRGVWLDRGEMEKIIERETAYYEGDWDDDDRYEDDRERYRYERERGEGAYYRPEERGYRYGPPKKKKKGFLRELLDFEFLGGD